MNDDQKTKEQLLDELAHSQELLEQEQLGTTFLSLVEDRVLGVHDTLLPLLEDVNGRFIYAHYPVPSTPYLRIDPKTRELSSAGATYLESLESVDFFPRNTRGARRVWPVG